MKKEDFYKKLQQTPKAEIHIHIEAVSSLETVKKMYAKKNGKPMSDEEATKLFTYEDLSGFITAFLAVQDLYTSVDDFDFVFDDLGNYLERNGVNYCEAFFAPSAFLKKGFDYADIMKNFQKNIKKIEKERKIVIRILADVSRTFGPENAMTNLNLVLEHKIPEVIGIGLGGNERKGPSKDFGEVFEKARAAGLRVVAHAGEDVEPFSIWDAIEILKAERIGHGITAIQDEKLMDYLKTTQLPMEICPTSNLFTKGLVKEMKNHPIRAFFDKGIRVTVNTDDPVFFKVELLDEYWTLHSELNFTEDEIKKLIINSYTSSFLSDEEKKKYIAEVEKVW